MHLKKYWQHNWTKSKCYINWMQWINPSLPSPKYLKVIDRLTYPQAAIIMQLRLGHASLNDYLYCICKTISPNCSHCRPGTAEMVYHLLIECRYYRVARSRLENKFQWQAHNINFLLSSPKAFLSIIQYIKDTKHLQAIFGNLTSR